MTEEQVQRVTAKQKALEEKLNLLEAFWPDKTRYGYSGEVFDILRTISALLSELLQVEGQE